MAKYWDPPPPFSPKRNFFQNDSEWPEMDLKHNFKKCNILSAEFLLQLSVDVVDGTFPKT